LQPADAGLDRIREILRAQSARERQGQGDGDTERMKLCCVTLFNAGIVGDSLLTWQAKESSWYAYHSKDVQLRCGADLEATKDFLTGKDPGMPWPRCTTCSAVRLPTTSPDSPPRNSRAGIPPTI